MLGEKFKHFLIIGSLSIFLGVFFSIWTPTDLILHDRLSMRPGFLPFKWWKDPPDMIFLNVFPFNITNAEAYLNGTDNKLNVEEIGPIVFLVKLMNINATFNDNGTMTYVSKNMPIYIPEKNTLDLDTTMVVVPNWALLGIASYVSEKNMLYKLLFHTTYRLVKPQPFVRISLRNLLFNFTDPFLTTLNRLIPFVIPVDNAGLITRFFPGSENLVTVSMGPQNGDAKFLLMDNFEGSSRLPKYADDAHCKDSVSGVSEGVLYRQHHKKGSQIKIFRENVCRIVTLEYEKEVTSHGIGAFKFVLPNSTFHRSTPLESDCYRGDPVLPNGISDISKCYFDVPFVLSFPHLLHSDASLSSRISGLHPDPQKHSSHVILEPLTGMPLETVIAVQGSLVIRNLVGIHDSLKVFRNSLVPIFWMQLLQDGIPSNITWALFGLVNLLPVIQKVLCAFSVMTGIFLIYLYSKRKTRVRAMERALRNNNQIDMATIEKS